MANSGLSQPPFVRQLSVDELENAFSSDDWVVVDARSSDEYNGWPNGEMTQGGHIAGAVDFSSDWLQVDVPKRAEHLAKILQIKKILPGKKIAIYSSKPADREQVAKFLANRNFKHLFSFDIFDWLNNGGELNRYQLYQRLIPPVMLQQLLKGKLPPTFEKTKRIKFVEVSWGDEKVSYAKGHVPGSFHVNTDHFEPPPTWYLGSPNVLTKFAAKYGFQYDDTVIISSENVTASFRLAAVLEYMGIADVRVLNGGLWAWKRDGFKLETERHDPPICDGFGAAIPTNQRLILTTEAVKKELGQRGNFRLVDTRTWAEFIGQKSGYSYHKHKGRIEGSRYGQAGYKGPDSMTPYRNIDGTIRNASEIQAMWKQSGIDTSHRLCFLCGGGWRAAEVLAYAHVMGIEQSTLYSDGWIGWSNDPNNPIETGLPR